MNDATTMTLMYAAFRRYLGTICLNLLPLSILRASYLRLIGVHIGSDCYLGFGLDIDNHYPHLITIGNRVTISHNVSLITHTITPVRAASLAGTYHHVRSITISDDSWIGMNVTVCPGVTIGPNIFVAAGSVVARSLALPGLYAGNPATLVRPHE